MRFNTLVLMVLVMGLALTACAGDVPSSDGVMEMNDDAMMDDDATMDDETMKDDDMAESSMDDSEMDSEDAMMEDEMMAPGWFSVALQDVNSGNTFSIEDFKGKVVLVETMAVWCSNCLRQQREVQALHSALADREDFISIALDIDPNENADILRNFAMNNGFDWLYAIAPAEVANELGQLYGQQFLNPPSTPILLIDRHGDVHTLPFGIKSAGDLQTSIEQLLDGDM